MFAAGSLDPQYRRMKRIVKKRSHPNNTLSMVTPLMDCWRRGRLVSAQTPTHTDVLGSNTSLTDLFFKIALFAAFVI